jgi:hypothetical protein
MRELRLAETRRRKFGFDYRPPLEMAHDMVPNVESLSENIDQKWAK